MCCCAVANDGGSVATRGHRGTEYASIGDRRARGCRQARTAVRQRAVQVERLFRAEEQVLAVRGPVDLDEARSWREPAGCSTRLHTDETVRSSRRTRRDRSRDPRCRSWTRGTPSTRSRRPPPQRRSPLPPSHRRRAIAPRRRRTSWRRGPARRPPARRARHATNASWRPRRLGSRPPQQEDRGDGNHREQVAIQQPATETKTNSPPAWASDEQDERRCGAPRRSGARSDAAADGERMASSCCCAHCSASTSSRIAANEASCSDSAQARSPTTAARAPVKRALPPSPFAIQRFPTSDP